MASRDALDALLGRIDELSAEVDAQPIRSDQVPQDVIALAVNKAASIWGQVVSPFEPVLAAHLIYVPHQQFERHPEKAAGKIDGVRALLETRGVVGGQIPDPPVSINSKHGDGVIRTRFQYLGAAPIRGAAVLVMGKTIEHLTDSGITLGQEQDIIAFNTSEGIGPLESLEDVPPKTVQMFRLYAQRAESDGLDVQSSALNTGIFRG